MNKQDAKMLKELSKFTKESLPEIKRRWHTVPAKGKAGARRKLLTNLKELRLQLAARVEKMKNLPRSP